MKIIFNNTDLVFTKSITKTVIYFNTFETETGILGSDGTVRSNVESYSTTSSFQEIPVNTVQISVYYTGYSLVDGYCTCCVYDNNYSLLARGSNDNPIDLTNIEDAKYFKMSSANTSINAAYINFFIQ